MTMKSARFVLLGSWIGLVASCADSPTQPDSTRVANGSVSFSIMASDPSDGATYWLWLKDHPSAAQVAAVGQRASVRYVYDIVRVMAVRVRPGQLEALSHLPFVDSIAPAEGGVRLMSQSTPWGIDRIEAPWVGANVTTGTGIKVGIMDSGIDLDHPDLLNVIGGGVDLTGGNTIEDAMGHGTHVAGIIAAANNAFGVVGAAPNVLLYPIKIFSHDPINGWTADWPDILAGINWARNNGMDVVNMSFGDCNNTAPTALAPVQAAADSAFAEGVLLIAAAGNGTDGGCPNRDVANPARFPSVLAVSATNSNDGWDSDYSYGPEVEVAAPGIGIYSTMSGDTYEVKSGSSMASPHVAAAAALVIASGVAWSVSDVRFRLRMGTARVSDRLGYGIVNAAKAVTNAPLPSISGEKCLYSPGYHDYSASVATGAGGYSFAWHRDKAPYDTWANAGSGSVRSFNFDGGSYGERLRVTASDRFGRTSATIFQVYMESGTAHSMEATIMGNGCATGELPN